MALGCRAALFPSLGVHLKSDLGRGEGVPAGELSHPTLGGGGGGRRYSLTTQLHPISERRPFQEPSLLQRRPELHSPVPSSVPTCCALPFWASASSSRKAGGCQLMADVPLVCHPVSLGL